MDPRKVGLAGERPWREPARCVRLVWAPAVASIALLASGADARAAAKDDVTKRGEQPVDMRADGFHLAADASVDAPLSVGGRVQLEAPYRLRLAVSVGVLPGVFIGGINSGLVSAGAYDAATGNLVTSSLNSSLVVRTHVGVRPLPRAGFVTELGYGLVNLSGSVTAEQVASALTNKPLPALPAGTPREAQISSSLHMFDVEAGWEWFLLERVHLRAAIGGAFTVAANSSIVLNGNSQASGAFAPVARLGESRLNSIYQSYGFTPVMSLSAGYAFF